MFDDLPLIHELILPAVDRLHSLDIEPELTVSPLVQKDQLDAFNREFALTLPRQFCDVYAETDGFEISWRAGDDWGDFTFPSLYELRLHRQRWINGDMWKRQLTTHPESVFTERVLANMKTWLPFDESGAGNLMCLDCTSGRVVEFDHEWGNLNEQNGTIYGNESGMES